MNASYLAGLSKKDWLCLSFLSGIGPARLSRLHTYLDALDSELIKKGKEKNVQDDGITKSEWITAELLRKLKWPTETVNQAMAYLSNGHLTKEQQQKCDQVFTWLEGESRHLVFQNDEDYPLNLKEISVAPAFLYLEGALEVLSLPKVGIVGARKCTVYGRESAFNFAYDLSSQGICIVSGGAIGIDTAAHSGALNSKTTPTLAVMGTGLLHPYPNQNKSLFMDILNQGGALLSEYPLSTTPRPHLFPPRNRLISGLSLGVLVAEASVKSGSLISASYALQQNREVFALPARVSDLQSSGCHQLIRQGAILVRNSDDILSECLPAYLESKKSAVGNTDYTRAKENVSREKNFMNQSEIPHRSFSKISMSASEEARLVADILEKQNMGQEIKPLDFDALIHYSKLSAGNLMQVLMELELNGNVSNREGLYYRT